MLNKILFFLLLSFSIESFAVISNDFKNQNFSQDNNACAIIPTKNQKPPIENKNSYAIKNEEYNQINIQQNEYLKSDVFGANLFTGSFVKNGVTQFNPDYHVNIGDEIQLRMWGAYQYDSILTVDPKGNIFIPEVGAVSLIGVKNKDIQKHITSSINKVFKSNVNSYANLASAQPVRVFVGGYVKRPGLYNGTSLDSVLNFIDQSGGIDPERGSFLSIEVKRGEVLRANINLYDFLLKGIMPQVQLSDGDVIFVTQRKIRLKFLV